MKRPKNLDRSKPSEIELPETAQVIAEVIGRDATLSLVRASKGLKIYVPKTLCAGHEPTRGRRDTVVRPRCTCKGHWIAKTIGDDLAIKMSWHFGGETLDLALCFYIHAVERNERIRQEFAAGMSRLELRRAYGLSERAIRYIVKGYNGRPDRPNATKGVLN